MTTELKGLRHNTGKPRMDLVAPELMRAAARVAGHPMVLAKYSERNWELGMPYGKVYASLMRHLAAWWEGEDNDRETGLSHLDHIAWNSMALSEYFRRRQEGSLPPEIDDRPHKTRG